jgi:tetratricopeptide (TPR) repeat protein
VLYANGLNNEYSLDDNIVVDRKDSVVEKGFKAIPKILKSKYAIDVSQSYGFRPVTTISFAIEKQFFKGLPNFQTKDQKKRKDKLTQANVSHFINLLLYALTCIILFQVLSRLFDSYHILLTFVITLIFILHPLHTEVVSNIKSRDELLMFLFMLLSIKHYINFETTRKIWYIGYASLFALLSILSKKNGFALLGILPVIMYYKGFNWKRIVIPILSFVVIFVVFKFIKRGIVDQESIRDFKFHENPLLLAGSFMDRVTVGIYCSWHYLKMLIFPYNMSFYYGYNQIPMATWKFWEVWVALLIYVPIGVYGFIQLIKRNILGLGIILWLGVMLSVVNILMPMVGIVADRFAYTFSLGFCIVAGYLLLKLFKIDLKKDQIKVNLPNSFVGVFAAIAVLYGGRTIARNPDWHDYLHTYQADVDAAPKSAKVHSLVANTMYSSVTALPIGPERDQKIADMIYHYEQAIEIDSTYEVCYSNLGSTYIEFLGDNDKGIYYCSKALELNPEYFEATLNLASAYDRKNMLDSALKYYVRIVELEPNDMSAYNLFNNFVTNRKIVGRGIAELKLLAEQIDEPKFVYTDIGNLYALDPNKYHLSIEYFEKAYAENTEDKIICKHLYELHTRFGNVEKAKYYQLELSK